MGLDNIPHVYPCRKAGTDIKTDDGRIDCDATIAADRCPWQVWKIGRGDAVSGIFGTPCWYRGKAGNWMLEQLREAGHEPPGDLVQGFYGDDEVEEGNPQLSPEYCVQLGNWMAEHIEAFAVTVPADQREAALDQYRYAADWLRWIAVAGDGSGTWW